MAKVKISEFNSNPALNTDIDSINIAEGCSPSGINDAIRELMAQLKDWQSGTSNDPYVVGSSGSLTLNQGTANTVPYLNGSKVVTSGSALTFDGTNFATTGQIKSTLNGVSFLASGSTGQNLLYSANNGTQEVRVGIASSNLPYIGTISNDPLVFLQNGSERMRLDSSGNLGLGVTPSAWSAFKAFEIASAGNSLWSAGSNDLRIATNYVYSGGDKYVTTGRAATYIQTAGQHQWYNSASGTAGNAITFTQAMTLDASGNLGIGTTSPSYRLDVQSTDPSIRIKNTTAPSAGGNSTLLFEVANNFSGTSQSFIKSIGAGNSGATQLTFGTSGSVDATATERARIDSSGRFIQASGCLFQSVGTYNNVTGNAANVYIGSGGILERSTSSLKYKKNVQDATHGLDDLLKLRSVTYEGKAETDAGKTFGGLIAEEVHKVGLTEFVQYSEDGTPDALAYGNMVSLCIKAIQEMKAIIDDQAARIAQLEAQ